MPSTITRRKLARGKKNSTARTLGGAPKKSAATGKPATAKRGVLARYPWKEEPNPYIELRSSAIQGTGAFALRPIRKGTRLIEYLGERISWRTADRRYDDEKMGRHHTFLFTVDEKTVIDGAVKGNLARFLNHSCDGNCEAITERKRIFLEARRNIKAGEELLYDYQYERTDAHTAADERFYACRCGSPKCRGSILAPRSGK